MNRKKILAKMKCHLMISRKTIRIMIQKKNLWLKFKVKQLMMNKLKILLNQDQIQFSTSSQYQNKVQHHRIN